MNRDTSPAIAIDINSELSAGFASRFIRAKAKRLIGRCGFGPSDLDDLRQQLSLALLKALPTFDPAVAPWESFVSTVVNRRAAKILKRRRASKREYRHHVGSLSVTVPDEDGLEVSMATQISESHREGLTGRYRSSEAEQVETKIDLEDALAHLPHPLRQLCDQLAEKTLTEIARETGVSRRTLREKAVPMYRAFEFEENRKTVQNSPATALTKGEV